MAIYSTSRYTFSQELRTDGKLLAKRKPAQQLAYQIYIVRPGDTFEGLAAKIYGDSSQHWRLLDLNPEIEFSLDLAPNDKIRIPV